MLRDLIRRSSTIKLTLLYAGLFGAAVLVLLGYVYWSTTSYLRVRSDRAIDAEHSILIAAYRQTGRDGLADMIARRSHERSFRVYLLADASLRPIAGNLRSWPAALTGMHGWDDFLTSPDQGNGHDGVLLRAIYETLPDGSHLLVGRAIDDLGEVASTIYVGLFVAVALMILVAAIAAISVTRRTVGRIETINIVSRQIMRSDLSQRIPLRGDGDEWDRLADSLNAMLDRIEELIREIMQVSDNLAHDLRTPLMRLRGRLEKALHLPRDAGDDQLVIEQSLGDLDAVLSTFSSLLRIAEIGAHARRAAFRRLDLGAIARDVAELFGPAAEAQGGSITLAISGDAEVDGDRDLLFNAMSSLIDNAFKHGGTPPLLTITVSGTPTPRFSIGDRGPGIPAADRKNVLKRFFRLERSRHTPGSGLGLSLVSAIAHLHDATIELGDNAPGLVVHFCVAASSGTKHGLSTHVIPAS